LSISPRIRDLQQIIPALEWLQNYERENVRGIDAVAIDALEDVIEDYRSKGTQYLFAGMKGPLRDLVAKAGWEEKYGEQIKHPSIQHALRSIRLRE